MTKRKLDKDSPSMTPHGDVLKVPGGTGGENDKPDDKGIDVPAEPGKPTPGPSSPDLPGGPPEPVAPGKPPTL
ncbi:hypothetical protein [Pusillimonas sp.]|uniref:hypothetical protein n=1 Tax=Pusillimonas sp. TaxID=3040095 RepID=UPI0037CBBC5B